MKSTKCPQCGLVYWSTAPNCKRCGLATAGFTGEGSSQTESVPSISGAPPVGNYRPPVPAQTTDNSSDVYRKGTLKRDAILFYVVGALQCLLWLFMGNLMIVDGVLNISLAFIASQFKSRVAAVCLLGLTLLSVIMAIYMMATEEIKGNAIMAVVLMLRLYCSARMVQTTFWLKKNEVENFVLPPPPPVFHPENPAQWSDATGATQWQQT